jgi:hypothetical protein
VISRNAFVQDARRALEHLYNAALVPGTLDSRQLSGPAVLLLKNIIGTAIDIAEEDQKSAFTYDQLVSEWYAMRRRIDIHRERADRTDELAALLSARLLNLRGVLLEAARKCRVADGTMLDTREMQAEINRATEPPAELSPWHLTAPLPRIPNFRDLLESFIARVPKLLPRVFPIAEIARTEVYAAILNACASLAHEAAIAAALSPGWVANRPPGALNEDLEARRLALDFADKDPEFAAYQRQNRELIMRTFHVSRDFLEAGPPARSVSTTDPRFAEHRERTEAAVIGGKKKK